jgi:hypothetical protein
MEIGLAAFATNHILPPDYERGMHGLYAKQVANAIGNDGQNICENDSPSPFLCGEGIPAIATMSRLSRSHIFMRVFFACVFFVAAGHSFAQAMPTSICDILAHPSAYDGKMIQVTGTVVAGLDEFVVKDRSCGQPVDGIWLSYPEGTKAKAGPRATLILQLAANSPAKPAVSIQAPVSLDKNKEFKRFDDALDVQPKTKGQCLGCPRYAVTATLTGRIDAVDAPALARQGKMFSLLRGFGNMNRYPARLVLQSVSNVSETEIDYSKPAAVTAPGISLGLSADQVSRAAAAFGAEGEDNGVVVNFGVGNTVPKDGDGKAKQDSPDGLLIFVTIDTERLKGPALGEAMAHVGTHIADLRETPGGRTLLQLEAHAWAASILTAIQSKEKTLTLPGGYLVWNSDWTDVERERLLPPAMSSFLTDWSALNR